jgi:hypothetical protein
MPALRVIKAVIHICPPQIGPKSDNTSWIRAITPFKYTVLYDS